MRRDGVAAPVLDVAERRLEALVGERLDLAAAVADEVVVMMVVGPCRLEPRDPVARIHALDEA